jgi:hypothetical protein
MGGLIMADEKLKVNEAAEERSTTIDIGGAEFKMILTTKATKEIAKRYGGLDNLGDKLMKTENFEMALEEVVWLITLLANQSILIHNIRNKNFSQKMKWSFLPLPLIWLITRMPLWPV